MTLNILIESMSAGYYVHFIFLTSLICILLGISIIVVKNPVFSVLFLIGLFLAISIYLQLLGLSFIGLSYLLVYVGAVSILFLFILMLLNIRVSELITEGKNSIPLAIITVLYLTFSINLIVPYSVYMFNLMFDYIFNFLKDTLIYLISYVNLYIHTYFVKHSFSNVLGNSNHLGWDSNIVYNSHIASIGNILYGDLLILLLVLSLILLLSMIGAILITIKTK